MKNYLLLISIVFFTKCQFGDYSQSLVGNYRLYAPDEKEAMSIYVQDGEYWIGVIVPTVFAVGYDQDFIIVKQHPRKFPSPPDKSIDNYFIIPLKFKVGNSVDDNKIGPLTKRQFEEKCNELKVSKDLKFTKVFKNL